MKPSIKFLIFIFLPLAALLLNDLYLKQAFPGHISGKLSDVVGLWTWVVFFLYFFSNKARHIAVFSSLIFIWWKSPFSQGFISFLTDQFGINLHRSIDYSDIWALAVFVPFILYNQQILTIFKSNNLVFNRAFLLVSTFAFFATSSSPYSVSPRWSFKDQKFDIKNSKRDILKVTGYIKNEKLLDSLVRKNFFELEYYNKSNSLKYTVTIILDSIDIKRTQINLSYLLSYDFGRKKREISKEKFLKIFTDGYIKQASTLDSTLGSGYYRVQL